jgi:hypothetical protein
MPWFLPGHTRATGWSSSRGRAKCKIKSRSSTLKKLDHPTTLVGHLDEDTGRVTIAGKARCLAPR